MTSVVASGGSAMDRVSDGNRGTGKLSSSELTENIHFMKLLHELKASFPAVPDDIVKTCVLEVS